MSGGHWDYRHGSAAIQCEMSIGVSFIDEVIEEVKADLGHRDGSYLSDFTPDTCALVSEAITHLEAVKPEIDALCKQLVGLVGSDSKVYKIIDAIDLLYSGDSSLESFTYRLSKALEVENKP